MTPAINGQRHHNLPHLQSPEFVCRSISDAGLMPEFPGLYARNLPRVRYTTQTPLRRDVGLTPASCRLPLKGGVMANGPRDGVVGDSWLEISLLSSPSQGAFLIRWP